MFVYAFLLGITLIAFLTGITLATAKPTVISSEGIVGVDFACSSDLRILPFRCNSSLSSWGHSRQMIGWGQIEKVTCISRRDGTISELYIRSGGKRGSLAVHDLREVHQIVLAHAPAGVAEPLAVWDDSTTPRCRVTCGS